MRPDWLSFLKGLRILTWILKKSLCKSIWQICIWRGLNQPYGWSKGAFWHNIQYCLCCFSFYIFVDPELGGWMIAQNRSKNKLNNVLCKWIHKAAQAIFQQHEMEELSQGMNDRTRSPFSRLSSLWAAFSSSKQTVSSLLFPSLMLEPFWYTSFYQAMLHLSQETLNFALCAVNRQTWSGQCCRHSQPQVKCKISSSCLGAWSIFPLLCACWDCSQLPFNGNQSREYKGNEKQRENKNDKLYVSGRPSTTHPAAKDQSRKGVGMSHEHSCALVGRLLGILNNKLIGHSTLYLIGGRDEHCYT